jgi:divalent metal cation (Fe/Co/Zn/Cd) transporter
MNDPDHRTRLLERAAGLSVFSVVWSGSMAAAGMVVSLRTGSQSLGGFALDSLIDAAASVVLVWRFRIERRHPHRGEHVESLAALAVGIALIAAGAYVAVQAIRTLLAGGHVHVSGIAIAIAVASLLVLPPLALAKRRVGRALPSSALRHDAFLTFMGAVLAAVTLLGMALASVFDISWADPAAALAIAMILVVDGWQAIRTR